MNNKKHLILDPEQIQKIRNALWVMRDMPTICLSPKESRFCPKCAVIDAIYKLEETLKLQDKIKAEGK